MPRNPLCVKTLSVFAALMLTVAVLTGCSGGVSDINPWGSPKTENSVPQQPTAAAVPPVMTPGAAVVPPVAPHPMGHAPAKVGILVPLSGKGSDAGQAMLNAAQLALFDLGDNAFELMPRDTQGTPEGARAAAESAVKDGARLLLGPIFAADVRAVAPVAASNTVNVIAFSTDWTVASTNTFIMSFLPHSQVKRVLEYAASRGIKRVAIIAANDAYGNVTAAAFDTAARQLGLTNVAAIRFDPAKGVTEDQLRSYTAANGTAPFQAVLIAADSSRSATISKQLTKNGLTPNIVKRLGTGLWDDPAGLKNPELQTGWYAASSPTTRTNFENNYRKTYSETPLRIASLAYDATALAAVLAKSGKGFDRAAVLNPNGFSGIDGIFRFRPDGLVDRGLAILEIRNGQAVVIEDAPRTFQNQR